MSSYYFGEKPRLGKTQLDDKFLDDLQIDDDDFDDFHPQYRNNRFSSGQNGQRPNLRRDPFDDPLLQSPIGRRKSPFSRGFPFDEEGPGRRSTNIRSYLNNLASRHPEFADHILGPPWADIPFNNGSSPNRTRRGPTQQDTINGYNHNHPDEDIRSQCSSGSGGSSAVSSHGDPLDNPIPPPAMFNNVDMDYQPERPDSRNQRSMSAPPENNIRPNHPQNDQRFVSRIDIGNPPNGQQSPAREKSPAPQKAPPSTGTNVRHIPIFVEGRDKPVLARDHSPHQQPPTHQQHHHHDEPDFTPTPRQSHRQQSPPQFHRPSHFHRPVPPPGWDAPFRDPFFSDRWSATEPQQSYFKKHREPEPDIHHQPKEPEPEPQPPKAPQAQKPVVPKDPLEKVALVQNEVDALAEQVAQFQCSSRSDKQYMYLDEMLTRELIKLDDIETEGKDQVRQARKQAIKSIQDAIALLESKVPLPNNQPQVKEHQHPEEQVQELVSEEVPQEVEQQQQQMDISAIPLPAPEEQKETSPEPMEVTRQQTPPKEVKTPKKTKKTPKKQKAPEAPVSEEPIPLPPPVGDELDSSMAYPLPAPDIESK